MMNGNGQAQPQPAPVFDGRTEASVTLQLNTWNVILALIAEAPWKTADPLIAEVRRQLTASLDPAAAEHSAQPAAP
jgi:hypothetical protein